MACSHPLQCVDMISFLADRVEFQAPLVDRRNIIAQGRHWDVFSGDLGTIVKRGSIRVQRRKVTIFWITFDRHDAVYPRPFIEDDIRYVGSEVISDLQRAQEVTVVV